MKSIALIFFVTLLTACASGIPVTVPNIRVASPEMVTHCQYLDTVYGTSSWYGVFAEKGIENARISAFDKAQGLEGTDIVWESIPQNHGSSNVAGKVYLCKQK